MSFQYLQKQVSIPLPGVGRGVLRFVLKNFTEQFQNLLPGFRQGKVPFLRNDIQAADAATYIKPLGPEVVLPLQMVKNWV